MSARKRRWRPLDVNSTSKELLAPPRRITVTITLILVLAPLAASGAQPGFHPMTRTVGGSPARRRFSARRSSCRAASRKRRASHDDVFHWRQARLDHRHPDRSAAEARSATLGHKITREAKLYGDQGCVIHQPGRDSVFFKPVRVTTTLPAASTLPWPMGDVLQNAPLPPKVDSVALRQAVDAAFATPPGLTAAFSSCTKGESSLSATGMARTKTCSSRAGPWGRASSARSWASCPQGVTARGSCARCRVAKDTGRSSRQDPHHRSHAHVERLALQPRQSGRHPRLSRS